MNGKDLFNALGNIDDKYISEFADASQFKKKMPFFLSPKFYSGIAAVFVIGIAVLIALQMNQKPIDIQNNSLNNAAANSYGSKSDIPPVTENAAKDIGSHPAATDNFAQAEEPYYNNPKSEGEQIHDVLFSIKVYAAEKTENLSQSDVVKIKGDFNPLMSSSTGIGIEFEVTPYEAITLRAESLLAEVHRS